MNGAVRLYASELAATISLALTGANIVSAASPTPRTPVNGCFAALAVRLRIVSSGVPRPNHDAPPGSFPASARIGSPMNWLNAVVCWRPGILCIN